MAFNQANQAIQVVLNDRVRNHDEGLLRALVDASRENTSISVADNFTFGPGKKRQAKVIFYGPVCEDDGECTDNICDTGVKIEPSTQIFNITQCTSSAVYELMMDDVRLFDGNWSFSDHAKAQIASVLGTVRGKMAAQLATQMAAATGVLPNGTTTQTLPFINENGSVSVVGMDRIRQAYFDTAYTDNPYIVGSGPVFNWREAVRRSGLSQDGMYLDRVRTDRVYYDRRITAAYGSTDREDIIAFDPQMIKLVTFSRNAGIFATDLNSIDQLDQMFQRGGTNYMFGVMVDPATGLLWDLHVRFDDCTQTFSFQWKIEWELITMPPMACNIPGINGIFHFQTCPYVETECEGTPITPYSPAGGATFRFDGTDVTYPLFVGTTVVAGQTNQVNTTVATAAELRTLLNNNSVGYTFAGSGTNIDYTGYSAISFKLNNTTYNFEQV